MVSVAETETLKREVIMPGGDRTGPEGIGPMTGRRMGFCAGNEEPGNFYNPGFGFRTGRGFRAGNRGRMHRRSYWRDDQLSQRKGLAVTDRDLINTEIKALKAQVEYLEERLNKLKD